MATNQRGAVSIFIVIFTALLVTIVTTSFIQIMLRNQQQASNNDLSQSAYDSAMAGVEDAKRALVALKQCSRDSSAQADCSGLRAALTDANQSCEVLGLDQVDVATFVDRDGNREVPVGDDLKNQAYTCVTVKVVTESYEGSLDPVGDPSDVIPLESENGSAFSHVRISWFQRSDIPEDVSQTVEFPDPAQLELLRAGGTDDEVASGIVWKKNFPGMIRSQLIQYDRSAGLRLNQFNDPGSANARSAFLYPGVGGSSSLNLNVIDERRSQANSRTAPQLANCVTDFSLNGGYACSTVLELPAIPNRQAYLQLTGLYNNVSYKVQLCSTDACAPNNVVNFDNVQPIVDATGRASDLFRRVRARVAIDSSPSVYPEAALQLGKSLCKDFFVTNNSNDYDDNASDDIDCDPRRTGEEEN